MKNPYLIQRLQKPYQFKDDASPMMKSLANAFSFGGGLVNGGISKEAMGLLNKIWNYDYMGSSEFEWGAVPKSLELIAKSISSYVAGETLVTGKVHDYRNDKDIEKKAIVYFVCKKDDEKEVCEWISKFANDKKRDYRTKESVCLADAICESGYRKDTGGWHDIENHYLFFTDKTMYENFCKLFGCMAVTPNEV